MGRLPLAKTRIVHARLGEKISYNNLEVFFLNEIGLVKNWLRLIRYIRYIN